MKTTLVIILVSISIFLVACNSNHLKTTEAVVMDDHTDKFLSRPVAKEVLALYGLDQNKWNGAIFKFSDLTKVSFNEIQVVRLSQSNEFLSNRFIREAQVTEFTDSVANIIDTAEAAAVGQNNSSIYYPVANALIELSQNNSDTKYMLLYSDMMENTSQVCFYSKDMLNEIKEKPQAVMDLLESQVKLPSLSGISIYLIYEPTNILQDDEFKIVSAFYKSFFESKGATVIITPNLQI